MAKTNKAEILKLIKDINKKEGDGTVIHLGMKDDALKIERWSTNIEDLDASIGGGMPEGRIIEIFGPESSGKTSLALHLASLHDMALYLPTEGTFDAIQARSFGNRPKQLMVYRPKYGEQAMNKMLRFAQAGMPIIILDSVAATKPKEDTDKIFKNANQDKEGNKETARLGGTARLMHEYLPALQEVIETTGTTIILINQVRDKMNAMMFGEKTDTPGGRAPKFYSSLRIQVARKAWIEVPNKDPRNAKLNEQVGLIMKGKVVKSKVCNPFREFEIPLFFNRGFKSYDDISAIRAEIMKENNAKFSKRGRNNVADDDDDDVPGED